MKSAYACCIRMACCIRITIEWWQWSALRMSQVEMLSFGQKSQSLPECTTSTWWGCGDSVLRRAKGYLSMNTSLVDHWTSTSSGSISLITITISRSNQVVWIQTHHNKSFHYVIPMMVKLVTKTHTHTDTDTHTHLNCRNCPKLISSMDCLKVYLWWYSIFFLLGLNLF